LIDGQADSSMSVTRIYLMMNKILALSPLAIQKYKDWLKIFTKLGPSQGIFIADFPRKKWIHKFNLEHSTINTDDWDDWDEKKINEFFAHLQSQNGFISLNSPYRDDLSWEPNFLSLPEDKIQDCVAIGARKNQHGVQDFDQFDIKLLNVNDTASVKLTPENLISLLKNYILNTEKVAFVDRHNYLLTPNGEISEFTKIIQKVLELTKTKPLGEILIYSIHNTRDHPYMDSTAKLADTLQKCFARYKSPSCGIKYMCCSEAGTGDDLHARYILTKNTAFQLTDSFPGTKNSQTITRLRDPDETERLLSKWIDEKHKLTINIESTYMNLIS
jgi:hypothetical protein